MAIGDKLFTIPKELQGDIESMFRQADETHCAATRMAREAVALGRKAWDNIRELASDSIPVDRYVRYDFETHSVVDGGPDEGMRWRDVPAIPGFREKLAALGKEGDEEE